MYAASIDVVDKRNNFIAIIYQSVGVNFTAGINNS